MTGGADEDCEGGGPLAAALCGASVRVKDIFKIRLVFVELSLGDYRD